jgi:recombination protein RecA
LFSIRMAAALDLQALLVQLGSAVKLPHAPDDEACNRALSLSWPELDDVLPDGGLPRGVVELSAQHALGGSTSVALAAVRAGQARVGGAWSAWLDPEATLHAPGVVAAGVELARMLVVRCPREQLGRVAVQVVASGAFDVVVVDFDRMPRARTEAEGISRGQPTRGKKRRLCPEVLVRKLSLAAEPSGTTVLLLTDATKPRAVPWPVALRLELSRPSSGELAVRVVKEKRGRIGLARTIPFRFALKVAV